MKNIRTLLSCLAALALTATPLAATAGDGEMTYTNDTGKGSSTKFGTNKVENYNVAIHLTDKNLVGVTIKRIRVPMDTLTGVSNLRVWLTTELQLKTENGKKVNDPNVFSQDAEMGQGWIDVELASPYTITDAGIYVGYSFDLDSLTEKNKYPVVLTTETGEESFYVFTSRTYRRWMDKSSTGSSPLQVILSGVESDAASLSIPSSLYSSISEETPVTLTVKNHGSNGIASFDYTYSVNGVEGTKHVDLGDDAVANVFNASTTVEATLPVVGTKGAYPITLTVTKVNGAENSDVSRSADATLNIFSIRPVHRPLMEEYTGCWCGYCPRGFVALQLMNKLYPDDFVAVSYHNSDAMEIMDSKYYPSSVSGFPVSFMDRTYEVDPYMGTDASYYHFGIKDLWNTLREQFSPANIEVTAVLSDAGDKVTATADVSFVVAPESSDYGVEFMLVADDLHGEGSAWQQSNYYSGSTGVFEEPEFEVFTNGSSSIDGLHYDDVIIATNRLNKGLGVLPSRMEADKTYTARTTFTLADVVNTSGESLVQNTEKLRIVAVLIDNTTGAVVNCNKAKVVTPTGVVSVKADATGAATVYDLCGRRMDGMKKGVNIVKTANGRIVKVLKNK